MRMSVEEMGERATRPPADVAHGADVVPFEAMGESDRLEHGTGPHGVVEHAAGVGPYRVDVVEEGVAGGRLDAARHTADGGVGVAPRIPEPVAGAELDPP